MNVPAPQSVAWAARVPRESLAAAAKLRLRPVEACVVGQNVWLRGTDLLDEIKPLLAALTGAEVFTVALDGSGTPVGARVPTVRMPAGPWNPLSELLAVNAPTAALPGTIAEKVQLRLVRSEHVIEPNVLVASPEAWRDFALSASTIRLRPLKFALSAEFAVIWGRPVPSIAGTRYSEEQGIAVPSGLALAPVSDPEILIPLLGLAQGDLAVFAPEGSWELIESGLFVPATRSAVRQSFRLTGSDAT